MTATANDDNKGPRRTGPGASALPAVERAPGQAIFFFLALASITPMNFLDAA